MTRTTHRYGPGRAQVCDLWRPRDGLGSVPAVVLVHGGFWKGHYTKVLMRDLARAVTERGWVAWNIEYRRVGLLGGGGGWPYTFVDVGDAVDMLLTIDGVDASRVVVCGHSAGGHLALWAAARQRLAAEAGMRKPDLSVRGVVSLAGLGDLREVAKGNLGARQVRRLLGGSLSQVPDRYRMASPAALLPLGVPQRLVHGTADTTVPPSMSERYSHTAKMKGDDARFVPVPGAGHRDMIRAPSPSWDVVADQLAALIA
jgi:acetyl esterase/lipase